MNPFHMSGILLIFLFILSWIEGSLHSLMLVKKTRESLLYSEAVAFPSIIIPYLN